MSTDDAGTALFRLDEQEIREAVAAGDTSAFDDLELTEEERAMLVAAADDYPEVAGFSLTSFKVESVANKASPILLNKASPFGVAAATFVKLNIRPRS